MSRDVLDHLEDILENALAACEFASGLTDEGFVADRKALYAVMRALEIIGEAAKRIPDDVRARHPDIDWRGMAGLRDVIVGLDVGMGDGPHLQRVGDDHPGHIGAQHPHDRHGVAGGFDHDLVVLGQATSETLQPRSGRVDPAVAP